jgi:hypothetical protein
MLMLSMAVPAGAKKQKPPPRPPTESVVTMTLVNGQGLATTCDGSSIVMQGSQFDNRLLFAAEGELKTSFPIDWQRGYPEPESSGILTGCHGGDPIVVIPSGFDTPEVFGGSLWLDPGRDGDTVAFKWLFDYYWEYIPRSSKRLTQHVLEMFDLSGEITGFDWTLTDPQLVSGTFTLSWFQKIDRTIIKGFEPFGDVELEFWLQIEPKPSG